MSRLYAAESNLSQTGSNADHRLRIAASNIPAFSLLIASNIIDGVSCSRRISDTQQFMGQGMCT